MRETEKVEDKVGEEWLGGGCGFNVLTHVSTVKTVSSYHDVYSFVFINFYERSNLIHRQKTCCHLL
jgi:hypothetical protein